MTDGPIGQKIIRFAVPVFIGNLFQQLYNTADALLVGNFLGSEALAAVSSTGNLIFLLISFFEGLAVGAGIAISRYFGAKEKEKTQSSIHTSVAFSLCCGILLTVLGVLFTPVILRWMGTPPSILPLAVIYTRIYFSGSLTLVLYNSFRGIMQAVGDSKHPLIYLVISSLTNVVLDILLITVFGMGVDGAALATVISQLLSVILCAGRLLRTKEDYRVRLKEIRIDIPMLREIVSYGIPAGVQNSVIGFANVIVQSNINAFGAMAVAGCGAYSKIEGFVFLPITSFVIALTTFVSQNLGAKEYKRAKKGAIFGILCAILLSTLIGIITYITAPACIRAFTQEPEAIAFGVQKARTCSVFYALLAASHSLSAVLRGAGKSIVPMLTMLIIWCGIRILCLMIFVPVFKDIAVVNWVYPFTWFLSTVVLLLYYKKADWIHGFK